MRALVVSDASAEKPTTYFDDDYNCHHRTDVSYVTYLYSLHQALKALASAPPEPLDAGAPD